MYRKKLPSTVRGSTSDSRIRRSLNFFLSNDGTHCPIQEPRPWSQKWSSHKLGGKAGVAYEIGLQTQSDDLAWVHGPFPAGVGDLDIFRDMLKGEVTTLRKNDL